MLICLTAFSSDYPPISDLIHLARCVKFNPQLDPWIVLIGLRGTEFNRRINLLRGSGRFNLGLALIGFRTTGAWRGWPISAISGASAIHERARGVALVLAFRERALVSGPANPPVLQANLW